MGERAILETKIANLTRNTAFFPLIGMTYFFLFKIDFRGGWRGERGRERERHIYVREIHGSVASRISRDGPGNPGMCLTGIEPMTLRGRGASSNQLSHTGLGCMAHFYTKRRAKNWLSFVTFNESTFNQLRNF